MIEEELTIEMIHLMAEGASEQVGALDSDLFAMEVQPAQNNFSWPNDSRREPWNTQTSFFFKLFTLADDDFRIKYGHHMTFLLAGGEIGRAHV